MIVLKKIDCSIYRGGTSKGVFLFEKDLAEFGENYDDVLLKIMGSPDVRQIDGLGGAVSTTSKVAIISPEEKEAWDVNYTFAQVAIDKPIVSYAGNCGNISSAVGVFAIESGLVKTTDPITTVKVYNTNTKKVIYEHIPTPDGKLSYEGDFKISGVPGSGLKIELEFIDPAGSMTGKLLPTGNVVDTLTIEGLGEIEVSIIDAANPLVFVEADRVGLTGKESASEIDSSDDRLALLEKIRGAAAEKLGFVKAADQSAKESPGVPKLTLVGKAGTYTTVSGETIPSDSYDLAVRMMSMQKAHKTIALTGALCTAAACVIAGTIPNLLLKKENQSNHQTKLCFGHGDGLIETTIDYEEPKEGDAIIRSISSYRTARKILTGTVFF
ncbi:MULTISPECIES: 2-methylaconitate cis-trans isomerase PrpF family protein [unclassified Enterococcus]|uniref:2-methylaconitate cis-trans isomerase PrpF family protein n=1 Tax=unclassified Enterococcus TaxID=2608891 RepID=UPI001CE0AA1E|nr:MULTISPECIES: PrpF domain-containing protein [unclassified Enterococcus]